MILRDSFLEYNSMHFDFIKCDAIKRNESYVECYQSFVLYLKTNIPDIRLIPLDHITDVPVHIGWSLYFANLHGYLGNELCMLYITVFTTREIPVLCSLHLVTAGTLRWV